MKRLFVVISTLSILTVALPATAQRIYQVCSPFHALGECIPLENLVPWEAKSFFLRRKTRCPHRYVQVDLFDSKGSFIRSLDVNLELGQIQKDLVRLGLVEL